MKILLRIDNINFWEKGGKERLEQLIGVLDKFSAKALLGITPNWHGYKTTPGVDYLKFLLKKGHKIALHGFEHKCPYMKTKRHKIARLNGHEFDCLDLTKEVSVKTQKKLLKNGARRLRELLGVGTDFLVPPEHAINSNTFIAMRQVGFKKLSIDNKYALGPYKKKEILIFPTRELDYLRKIESSADVNFVFRLFRRAFLETSIHGYFGFYLHTKYDNEETITSPKIKLLTKILKYLQNVDGSIKWV